MIRVLVFLIAAGLLALSVVWLADRPGQVAITWLGYRADTSVMVAVTAIIAVAIAAVLLFSAAMLSFVGWAVKQPMKRYGVRA